jgi:membrane associated rhomboid family serine protease
MSKHTVRQELSGVLLFVGLIWFVFILESLLPFQLESFGITPRTSHGLIGIVTSPFLHANLQHLISNTVPLIVLLFLLAGSKSNSWAVVAAIVIFSGALLWLLGRPATHIGASGLIYGLIAYLLVSGFREQRILPMLTALIVGFLYGGTLLFGILPTAGADVSWDGHLFGAIAGGAVAYWLTNDRDNATETVISG